MRLLLADPKKFRKCPHCKSNKGFEVLFQVCGSGTLKLDFKGGMLHYDREIFENLDRYASCLNCNKQIATDNLKVDAK